ncbi:hypothetical protein JHD46_05225 [Sulfurimonas sp. SAG-AH-194-C20]|nr:hypothetical protein [Sulfurimonas sp. SAG-AH-194-C20]
MFDEAIVFSKMIEDDGSNKPFPIQLEARAHQYQMDYNYFIFIVGKWVAKWTDDKSKTLKVLQDYGIYEGVIRNEVMEKNRVGFAFFLSETLELSIARDKRETSSYVTNVDKYPYNNQVNEYKNDYYDYRMAGISTYKFDYYNENIYKNNKYFNSNQCTQIAFHAKVVEKFWELRRDKGEGLKRIYFMVEEDDFVMTSIVLLEKNSIY